MSYRELSAFRLGIWIDLMYCTKWYWLKSIYLIKAVFNSSSQQTVTIIDVLKEF